MLSKLRQHRWAIALAILVGVLQFYPQLEYRLALGDSYDGVYRVISDDEPYYMARAQEIVDGHWTLSDPYFREHKDGPAFQFFLPDLLAAMPARLLGIGVYPLYHFYDFLLPLLLFLMVYAVSRQVLPGRFWPATVAAWFLLVGNLTEFNRPISPQLVFLPALTMAWLLLRFSKQPAYRWALLAGINLGVLFYCYFYHWTFYLVLLSLLIGYLAVAGKRVELKMILAGTGLSVAIGLPYFVQTWQQLHTPNFSDAVQRLGLLITRIPSGINIVLPALLVVGLLLWHWRSQRIAWRNVPLAEWMIFSGPVAAIVAVNHHLITGRNILFASHYQLISSFFLLLAIAWLVAQLKLGQRLLANRSAMVLATAGLAFGFWPAYQQLLSLNYSRELQRQQLAPVVQWVRQNVPADAVVASGDELSGLLPSYTSVNVLFDSDAALSPVSDAELLERFTLTNYWQPNYNADFIERYEHGLYGFKFAVAAGRQRQLAKIGWLAEQLSIGDTLAIAAQQALAFRRAMTVDDWLSGLDRYHVDYLIVDKNQEDEVGSTLVDKYEQYKGGENLSGYVIFQRKRSQISQ